DGTPFGSLAGVSVDEDGFVIASYNNGVSQRIGQAALATFPNPNALESVSGTAWGLSTDSGTFNLKVPGTGGSGTLAPFTLEASRGDLAAEGPSPLTTQRAYPPASRIPTRADELLEQVLPIER